MVMWCVVKLLRHALDVFMDSIAFDLFSNRFVCAV